MKAETRRIWLEAGIIFSLGVVLGLSFNTQLVMDAFSGRVTTAVRSVEPVARPDGPVAPMAFPVPVILNEVRELLQSGAVAVDARALELYADSHIAAAVSLPLGEVEELLPEFKLGVPPETTLIAYCSGFGCPDSFDLGLRLLEEGYVDVRVYEGGLPEWRDAGLPIEKGAP
ncbi:rhodanese-like domain-containing protein [Trichloromonas sp.]|uniref:rhodanese-like domain-containing protein n=1 Tax=Trichloromonas sp. TaxID=3069249 RepID=UPI003D8144B7